MATHGGTHLSWPALVHDSLVNLPQLAREIVHLDGELEGLLEEVVVVGDLVHELVDDGLQLDGVLVLVPGEGRGEQAERGEVEGVAVKLVLASHADAWRGQSIQLIVDIHHIRNFALVTVHEAVVLRLVHQVLQLVLGQGERHAGIHASAAVCVCVSVGILSLKSMTGQRVTSQVTVEAYLAFTETTGLQWDICKP